MLFTKPQIDYNAAYDDLLRPSITKQSFRKSVASISKRRRLTSDPEDREYVKRAASAVIYVKEDNSRSTKQLRKFLAKVSTFYLLLATDSLTFSTHRSTGPN
jgi:hypothetical protein